MPTLARLNVLGVFAVAALSTLVACSKSETTIDEGGKAGDECATNNQCESPLACVFSRCHQTCDRDSDCSGNARCVVGGEGHVCQLPDAVACDKDDDCNGEQVCAIDDQCRDACSDKDDCTEGQVCANSKQCASEDPKRDHVDDDGNILQLDGDASVPGTGKTDAGSGKTDAGSGKADAGGSKGDDAGTDAGSSTPSGISASNVDVDKLPAAPANDFKISVDCHIDTDDGRFGCSHSTPPEDFAYSVVEPDDGSRLAVIHVHSLQIDMGGVLAVTGALPLVIVSDTSVHVFGRLSASSSNSTPVGGGSTPGNGPGAGQKGVAGGAKASSGASFCGRGGRGALAPADGDEGVASGDTYGEETLSPLLAGSGGGGTEGGAGGGALQIVSATEILVGATGAIDAGGGGGGNLSAGGGSGGAVLLEAPTVRVVGVVSANGGGGGASVGGPGGADATPNSIPASGEIADLGGKGSAAGDANGGDGEADPTAASNRANGGGGGAGRIRINTKDGKATLTGKLSPTIDTKCASMGKL